MWPNKTTKHNGRRQGQLGIRAALMLLAVVGAGGMGMAAMSDVGVSAAASRGGNPVTTSGGEVVIPLDDTVAGGGSSTVTIEVNDTAGSVAVDAEVEVNGTTVEEEATDVVNVSEPVLEPDTTETQLDVTVDDTVDPDNVEVVVDATDATLEPVEEMVVEPVENTVDSLL